jgi:hypothetical protein
MYDLRNASFDVNFGPSLNGTFYSDLLDMDAAADKVLVNNTDIRSHYATLLGHLPANRAARINAAGTKAYIYIHVDGGLGKIQVIDLTAAITPSATYPVLAEVPVPYDMGDLPAEVFLTQANFAMTLSADERFAFLSGTSRVVAIALP